MNYHDILLQKIIFIITNDLTIGRNDNELTPFTNTEITKFIEDNNHNIEIVIQNIINDYNNDNELESLGNPEYDWITEYLYDFIVYENK